MGDLKNMISAVKVSSVLNRDVKQYGKKHLMDGDGDTCWNSEQGSPQWIQIAFESPQKGKAIQLLMQFQGGFCGKDCQAELFCDGKSQCTYPFYPKDTNSEQTFMIDISTCQSFDRIRLLFKGSTDLFGRIIVYNMELHVV